MSEADAWINELVHYSNMPAYNAALGMSAFAGMSALSGLRRSRPTAVIPVTKNDVQNQQIAQLRKLVTLNKQQISNYYQEANLTFAAGAGLSGNSVNFTTQFTGSGDYGKQVIGDKYINKALYLRFDTDASFPKYRVIVYWSRRAGNEFTGTSMQVQPDPAAFIVLKDFMVFPDRTNGLAPNIPNTIRIPLKNKQTVYNFSSSVLESGELRMRVIAYNDSTTLARTVAYSSRLMIANK